MLSFHEAPSHIIIGGRNGARGRVCACVRAVRATVYANHGATDDTLAFIDCKPISALVWRPP
jgi:hypothetical protein